MTGFALLGAIVVFGVVGAGFYWLVTNVTLKRQPERYVYVKDENGNEYVKENTDEPT